MTPAPQIKGIPLTLGGVSYTLPPASLATLEAMADQLDKVNASFSAGQNIGMRDMLFVIDFATACLRRNYPDISRQLVADGIGLENVLEVMQMCLDASGLMRKAHQAQAATDAAQEGGTLGESAGAASPPTS